MNKQDYIDALKFFDKATYDGSNKFYDGDMVHYVIDYKLVKAIKQALQDKIDCEWQPIETAPKDGTNILIRNCDGRNFVAFYDTNVDTDEEEEIWRLSGWAMKGFYEPTHWTPLPNPPQENPITISAKYDKAEPLKSSINDTCVITTEEK